MNIKGVDVSKYQAKLHIKDIQAKGYQFAFLKIGGSLIKDGKTKYKDPQFDTFYKEAKECKMPIGGYWYSCADSYEKGKAEAEYCYKLIKGKQFEYPIYIDIEDPRYNTKRENNDEAIKGFGDYLESKGYFVGICTYKYFLLTKISQKVVRRFTQWIACYTASKPSINTNAFDIWQNSSSTVINGVRIDTDYCYRDFPSVIINGGYNGYPKKTEPKKEEPKKEEPKPAKRKTNEEIAKEVIRGKWSKGAERKKLLTEAGYNYQTIQKLVNQMLK